jgi:hypothetical protein
MNSEQIAGLIWAGAIVAFVVLMGMAFRARKRGGAYRAGMIGATWEWQSQDKRKALELIEEERAEACDPEFAEGTGPDEREDEQRRGDAGERTRN